MTDAVTRQLVLLRHAKAEPGGALADDLRPLALAGRRQASEVGTSLRADGLVPDLVLVSGAIRTRQTWDLVRAGLGVPPEVARVSAELYTAGVRTLIGLLHEVGPEVRTLLVVGHEPTISQTAAALAGPSSDPAAVARVRVGVPTATYGVLDVPGPWAEVVPDAAQLLRVVSPA